MKQFILLISLSTIGIFAADNANQYSYQHERDAYDKAKNGDMNQHQYRHRNGSENQGQGEKKRLRDGSAGGMQRGKGKR